MDLKGATLNTGVSWVTVAIYHLSHDDGMNWTSIIETQVRLEKCLGSKIILSLYKKQTERKS